MLYDKPFWEEDRDMFGLLNQAEHEASLNPADYARRRGRFYLIWNASKTSGRPMLVALMAGNAAHDAETTSTHTLLEEITGRLRTVYPAARSCTPLEVIVTRWKRDQFTRGTYSYVGPETRSGDYDLMAESVGNLHFAGEATCGTHPATVHGAFLSGLRVASEVMDSMAGPINLPTPLVGSLPIKQEVPGLQYTTLPTSALPAPPTNWSNFSMATNLPAPPPISGDPTIKQEPDTIPPPNAPPFIHTAPPRKVSGPPAQSVCASDNSFWAQASLGSTDLDYEANIVGAQLAQLGDRPVKPARVGVNPFLLYTKDKWEECKAACISADGKTDHSALRGTIGKWWRAEREEVKAPYLAAGKAAQEIADKQKKDYDLNVTKWDAEAMRIRQEYMRNNPPPASGMGAGKGLGVSQRKTNVSNNVVLDHV